jgi:hypothetical protein
MTEKKMKLRLLKRWFQVVNALAGMLPFVVIVIFDQKAIMLLFGIPVLLVVSAVIQGRIVKLELEDKDYE